MSFKTCDSVMRSMSVEIVSGQVNIQTVSSLFKVQIKLGQVRNSSSSCQVNSDYVTEPNPQILLNPIFKHSVQKHKIKHKFNLLKWSVDSLNVSEWSWALNPFTLNNVLAPHSIAQNQLNILLKSLCEVSIYNIQIVWKIQVSIQSVSA